MAALTATFSNTGNIGDGLKVNIKEKTWVVSSVPATIVTDLAGNRTRLSGVESGKLKWNFTAVVKRTSDSGYAPLGDPLSVATQSIYAWAHPSTASAAQLKMTDVDGNTWNVLWRSTWQRPTGISGEIMGATKELYEVVCEVWQA